ncbi:DNA mismatch repair protein Msh6-like isoform X2 [Eriocheir sinensis]|uniref:DNA mismatch repair protein Msh6-like isoform X2 n=1 Tax=Eriocheir sinensis TaxID=95602 RepID=UPI0021C5B8F6|nr:DNA mismatch repair protein Msh6-like isoform X2 [Eriocheir sinensis]
MHKQPSIASFFSKSPSSCKKAVQESPRGKLKLKGNEVTALDMVWAKLEGHPWWPALVCCSPGEDSFMRGNLVHVQFFDKPPTRGWVKDGLIKPYGPAISTGVPSYRDATWIEAVREAGEAEQLPKEDRNLLLVEMLPSDDDMMEDDDGEDEGESDKSKENVAVNGQQNGRGKAVAGAAKGGEPKTKRRRIVLHSDSESEDDYKPEKDEAARESDDSVSSGVDEAQMSGPETESEVDSPVKQPQIKRRKSEPLKSRNLNSSLSSSPRTSTTTTNTTTTTTPAKVSSAVKSKLAMFAAKEAPAPKEEGSEEWPFLKEPWLKPENVTDRQRRRPDHPEYDPRTLYVPESFMAQQTPGMRQWWELKSRHYDTVLFFKMGKFYELFHMDALLGVQELGLIMMKGEKAHSGFPEVAYSRYSSALIEKGYKVARIEQTETPEMMEKRCKKIARPTKFDRVVRREVCQKSSRGTMVYGIVDGDEREAATAHLLALAERPARGSGEVSEYGVAFVDTSIGTFHVGQFVDDCHASRLRTLLAHYPVAQVLLERGRVGAKTRVMVNALVPANLREVLVPEKEFWTAAKTLSFLAEGPYFRAEGQDDAQWPQVLKDMMDEGDSLGKTAQEDSELALSALGALTWYLMDCRLEEQLLTRRMFERYAPPDTVAGDEAAAASATAIPAFIANRHHMVLDGTTLHNLEVFRNSNGGTEGTLVERLDHCSTPFGKRLLRNWICAPLCNPAAIRNRLDAIADLRSNPDLVEEVTAALKTLPDLERMLAKVHTHGLHRQSSHPEVRAIYYEETKYNKKKVEGFLSALTGFSTCIEIVKMFKGVRGSLSSSLLRGCVATTEEGGNFPLLAEALKFFDGAFDHAEAQREGKIIPHRGVDAEYDEALERLDSTKRSLADYLKEQCKYFGTKVVFWGNDKKRYQLEVPEHACRRAGDEYELISQRKGYKRYWTTATRELLEEMIAAEEQRNTSLNDIARRIFNQFDKHQKQWEAALQCMAALDVLCSLTHFSREAETVQPEVLSPEAGGQPFLEIRDGLHPCLLTSMAGEFIPNDVVVGGPADDAHRPLVLITGPNMGGKSTLMRQTALICLLAQLGSYVPAASCRLTPVDRVFTRVGASDRIMTGESTFYVELAETSSILQHATRHSLVLVDELGRGTATYDGTAIASGVVDALARRGCRTLFSTHYHALVDHFAEVPNISCGHMACMVEGEDSNDPSQETITFLYKFTEGSCPKSYGFNVARLAGLPECVIRRARQKAKELERATLKKQAFSRVMAALGDRPGVLKDVIRESFKSLRVE